MKNRILFLSFFALFGFANTILSQSFEGYISDNLPIWMDINPPVNGAVSGTYFYKKNGGSIALTGTVKGNTTILNEKNKSGAVTGIFTCTNYQDSMIGTWKKPNSTKGLSVKLYKVNPSFKTYANIPKADKLILANGHALSQEMNDIAGEIGKVPTLNFGFVEKGILSTNYSWEFVGSYSSTSTIYHTFDLAKGNEILLSNEINPAKSSKLMDKIRAQIQKLLDNHKKSMLDQEWLDAFGDQEAYDKAFNAANNTESILDNFLIKRGYVQIVIEHYFGFPHAAEAMDFSTNLKIPFSELNMYLNDNSILKNLK